MESIHEMTVAVEAMHTDCFGRAKPSALLYFIQQAAGEHCRLLGVDATFLADKNLFWAVSRTRVEITRLPTDGERITVKTWPMPTSRVAYPRIISYIKDFSDKKAEKGIQKVVNPVSLFSPIFMNSIDGLIGIHLNVVAIVVFDFKDTTKDGVKQLLGRCLRINTFNNKLTFFITPDVITLG